MNVNAKIGELGARVAAAIIDVAGMNAANAVAAKEGVQIYSESCFKASVKEIEFYAEELKKLATAPSEETQLLIEQLKIVVKHCSATGLKAGAASVEEAIKIILKEATKG